MKQKNGEVLLAIPLIILVIVVLSAVGYVWWSNSKITHINNESTSNRQSIKMTTNWGSYTHPLLGFSIQHPEDVVLLGNSDFSEGAEFIKKQELYPLTNMNYSIRLSILKRGNPGTDPESALQQETCGGCTETHETIRLNNAIGVKVTSMNGVKQSSANYYVADEQKKSPVVRIWLQTYDGNPDNAVFDQILSTFKFL